MGASGELKRLSTENVAEMNTEGLRAKDNEIFRSRTREQREKTGEQRKAENHSRNSQSEH